MMAHQADFKSPFAYMSKEQRTAEANQRRRGARMWDQLAEKRRRDGHTKAAEAAATKAAAMRTQADEIEAAGEGA